MRVCMSWMAGYVRSYVCCSLTIQSFLHQQSSFSLPEHYFHSLCHAPILVHTFFLLHSFTILSLPVIPVELSLDCYSALSSIVLLIYLNLFSLSAPLPLSYLTLFVSHSPAELPDWSNIYSYLPKGPISKEASVAKIADFLSANITGCSYSTFKGEVLLLALCTPYCEVTHFDCYHPST